MVNPEIIDTEITEIRKELERTYKNGLLIRKPEKQQRRYNKITAKMYYEMYHNGIELHTIEAHEQVVFSERFITLEEYYYGLVEVKKPDSEEKINSRIKKVKFDYNPKDLLHEFISSKLSFIPSILTEQINHFKNSSSFPCCTDNIKILKSIGKHYLKIIKSKELQINHFREDVKLNKKLSDLISIATLKIINRVLEINEEPQIKYSNSEFRGKNSADNYKLIWLGKQKQLLELIITLQNRGWVSEIPSGNIRHAAKSICKLFDLTGTKRSEKSNEVKSFEQYLKGDLRNGVRDYDLILGKRYSKKFSTIEEN